GPADAMERTMRKAYIVDEEDADGEKPSTKEKSPGDAALGSGRKNDPRLEDSKKQGQIAEIDHVNMGVDFGAAIFQKRPDILKVCPSHCGIASEGGMSGAGETFADARGVLMQDEDREDVAKDHTDDDETNAAEEKEAPCPKRRKRSARDCLQGTHPILREAS